MKLPYTSSPRPDPSAPWDVEEASVRLTHVLNECRGDYHFAPSEEDWQALNYLVGTAHLFQTRVSMLREAMAKLDGRLPTRNELDTVTLRVPGVDWDHFMETLSQAMEWLHFER